MLKRRIQEAREAPRRKKFEIEFAKPAEPQCAQLAGVKTFLPLHDFQIDILSEIRRIESYEITNPRMRSQGCVLWAEMGIGKTLIAGALMAQPHSLPTLFLTAYALVDTFKEEMAKFFGPTLRVLVYHGKFKKHKNFNDFDVVVVTYSTLALCEEQHLFDHTFHRIILDESHTIRSKKTVFEKLVRLQAEFRLCMTGTPIINFVKDIFAQLEFLGLQIPPHLRRDESLIDEWGLRSFIIQRRRDQVNIVLPKKHVSVHYFDLSKREQELHDAIGDARKTEPAFTMRALQVCTAPYLMTAAAKFTQAPQTRLPFEDNEELMRWLHTDEASIHSSKMRAFNALMGSLSGSHSKIIVFANQSAALMLAIRNLTASCPQFASMHAFVHGKEANIKAQFRKFRDSAECRVLFMTLAIGAQGLNLTHADVVIFLENWFAYALHQQAEARVHRMGQTREVRVIYLVARNSVDEEVYLLAQSKKEVSESVARGADPEA